MSKQDDLYTEIATLRTRMAGLTLAPARTTFLQRQPPVTMPSQPPIPQVALPNMAPPRYQSPPTTPRTPNRQPYNNTCTGLANPLQRTPDTNCNLRMSPATGTEAMPMGRMQGTARNQFTDWDCWNPYPKTTEGKVAYEAAMQAWWERKRLKGKEKRTNSIPLLPATWLGATNE